MTPELEKLERLEGTPVPGKTVTYKRPTRLDQEEYKRFDTVAQITKIAVRGTPKGDHYFRLGRPEMNSPTEGAIEVDNTQPGRPSLKIAAEGLFEESPEILGTLTRVALAESGVESATVTPDATNLSRDFLMKAGGTVLESAESHDGQVIIFYPTLPKSIQEHPLVA